ncbi:hypothetical protein VTO42DRAFT_5074 [Malbranchea cinnamomea]
MQRSTVSSTTRRPVASSRHSASISTRPPAAAASSSSSSPRRTSRKAQRTSPACRVHTNAASPRRWPGTMTCRNMRCDSAVTRCSCDAVAEISAKRRQQPARMTWACSLVGGGGPLSTSSPSPSRGRGGTTGRCQKRWQSNSSRMGSKKALQKLRRSSRVPDWTAWAQSVWRAGSIWSVIDHLMLSRSAVSRIPTQRVKSGNKKK